MAGRAGYTSKEDKCLWQFLIDQLKRFNVDAMTPKGNMLWEFAARKKITSHSAQSMRDRMRRVLLPRVYTSHHLSNEDVQYLEKKLLISRPDLIKSPVKKEQESPAKKPKRYAEGDAGPSGEIIDVDDDVKISVVTPDDASADCTEVPQPVLQALAVDSDSRHIEDPIISDFSTNSSAGDNLQPAPTVRPTSPAQVVHGCSTRIVAVQHFNEIVQVVNNFLAVQKVCDELPPTPPAQKSCSNAPCSNAAEAVLSKGNRTKLREEASATGPKGFDPNLLRALGELIDGLSRAYCDKVLECEKVVAYEVHDMIDIKSKTGKVIVTKLIDNKVVSIKEFKRLTKLGAELQEIATSTRTPFSVVLDCAKKAQTLEEVSDMCDERRAGIMESMGDVYPTQPINDPVDPIDPVDVEDVIDNEQELRMQLEESDDDLMLVQFNDTPPKAQLVFDGNQQKPA